MFDKEKSLGLQIDKSTETTTKICYYLDLPKTELEKHCLSKSERLILRKNRQNLATESERCVLDEKKICKKQCREFENQKEDTIICRNRCKIDEKRQCIKFENKKDFSKTLSVKIKKQPWENHQKCVAQIYQCYCNELNKSVNEEKDPVKINRTGLSNGKSLPYQERIKIKLKDKGEPNSHTFKLGDNELDGQFLKTFQIQYKSTLSLTARSILTSFTNKYIYYAIDDILYLLDSNTIEKNNLLAILYSSMLSLHNDFSINFFDIWIDSVYFNDIYQTNRFLNTTSSNSNKITETTITLKLHYFTRTPIKKPEPIW